MRLGDGRPPALLRSASADGQELIDSGGPFARCATFQAPCDDLAYERRWALLAERPLPQFASDFLPVVFECHGLPHSLGEVRLRSGPLIFLHLASQTMSLLKMALQRNSKGNADDG